jgi:hypothetical protein
MRKSLLSGCLLAVFAALIVWLGQLLGLDLQHVALLGAALGGVLGLVPHQHGWGKLGGFAVGFVVAWLGFALRAAVLPDAASGRAVAAFLVILVCVVASAASRERLPLWSTLIGAVAIVAAYEESYTNSPSDFLNDSPAAATTVLLAAAMGYLAIAVLGESLAAARDERESSDGVRPAVTGTHPDGAIGATDPHHTDLDRILAGENS